MGLYPNAEYPRRTSSMRYVTIAELSNIIRKNLWKIPHDIDLVIGIPRSGMLPATMVALLLNTRLTDIDSFVNGGNVFSYGLSRGEFIAKNEIKKILIVDDSIYGGNSLSEAKKKLETIQTKYDYTFCVPIATTQGATLVDIFFEIIDDYRVFEWNIFHHSVLNNACVDIDGVLCLDPVEDDDGERYKSFLKTARPLYLPTSKINTLISCRLEKYRALTEKWLVQNNISYNQLIMLDFPDKATRIAWNKHGIYKGEYYKQRTDCMLFIESSSDQAKIIAEVSNKPVYCVETNSIIFIPTCIPKNKKKLHAIRKMMPNVYRWLQKKYHSTKFGSSTK